MIKQQKTEDKSLIVKREGDSPTNSSNCLAAKGIVQKTQKSEQPVNQTQNQKNSNTTSHEGIWKVIFIIILAIGTILVQKVYQFHTDQATSHIPKGSLSDFWVSIVVAIVIGAVRQGVKYAFQEKIVQYLSDKRSKTQEEGMKRADYICKWVCDFVYYSFATSAAYLIIKDQPFLPTTLFGHGHCSNLFMNYPNVPEIPHLQIFYLVQAGAHLYTLIHQLVSKRQDPKFYEFALHHVLAMFLVWFSYMMNYLIVGVVVLLLHDPADVMLTITRIYTDLKNKKFIINVILFLFSFPTWVYTRNIIFPSCVIKSSLEFFMTFNFENNNDIFYLPTLYMISMLGILAVMHVYWTFFFIKAIITIIKGKDKNGNGYD